MAKEMTYDKSKDAIDNLIANVLKESKRLSEDKDSYVVKEWFDTGHAGLNLLLSANIYGGIPDNRITQLVGDPGTTKSYLAKKIMKDAIKKGWRIAYCDTEGDLDIRDFEKDGLDLTKILVVEDINNASKLRTKLAGMVEYLPENAKIMIVIDSLGNTGSQKEADDAIAGEDKADMTRAKILKSMFRIITRPAFKKRIPIIVVNHQYDSQGGYIQTKQIGGGSGSLYNSSIILELNKRQLKNDNNEHIGINVRVKSKKNRFAKILKEIEFDLPFSIGIERYSKFDELCIEYGICKKVAGGSNGACLLFGEEDKVPIKTINNEIWESLIKKYKIDEKLSKEFSYAKIDLPKLDIDDEVEIENVEFDKDGNIEDVKVKVTKSQKNKKIAKKTNKK